jgi:hypothetical protein
MTTGVLMFKRRWIWFGELMSDEGFTLKRGNKSIRYTDKRGSFEFGLEDGFLFPKPVQVRGEPMPLNQSDLDEIIERVITGIRAEGHSVQVYIPTRQGQGIFAGELLRIQSRGDQRDPAVAA